MKNIRSPQPGQARDHTPRRKCAQVLTSYAPLPSPGAWQSRRWSTAPVPPETAFPEGHPGARECHREISTPLRTPCMRSHRSAHSMEARAGLHVICSCHEGYDALEVVRADSDNPPTYVDAIDGRVTQSSGRSCPPYPETLGSSRPQRRFVVLPLQSQHPSILRGVPPQT